MAGRNVQVRVPWTWARVLLFLLVEIALLIVYNFAPRDRETIVFGATIIAGAFALYSYLRGIEDRRMQAASKMIERWNAPDRTEARKTMNLISESLLDPDSLQRTSKGQPIPAEHLSARLNLVSSLNFYEELAIGVFDGTLDEDKAHTFFAPVIEQSYQSLLKWIENERAIDRCPAYYTEFEKLAVRWRKWANVS